MKVYKIEIMRLKAIVNGYDKNMPEQTNCYLLSKGVAFKIVDDVKEVEDE